jgi:hypothetical protein
VSEDRRVLQSFADAERLVRPSVAIAIALTLTDPVAAQNVPYQSGQRAAIGSGVGQHELPRGSTLEPRVEAAIQYADNINLAEDSAEQANAFGLELAPGIYAAYKSDYFVGAIDYSLIGRVWDHSQYDDVSHELAANGRWNAVSEWFYVDGDASYVDTVIDPANGLNYGRLGIFGASNLVEQATASISPTLRKQFDELLLQASYSYGRVWYIDAGKGQPTTPGFGFVAHDDSEDQNANVSLGTAEDDRKLSGRISYLWQKSSYEQSLPYQFERAGFDGRWQLSPTFSLVGDVGKETDLDQTTTEGGLDSDYWGAGFLWEPDRRTSVEARYGERFFGSSYTVDIAHSARLVDFTASYSESPEVETRRSSLRLGDVVPGELPPGVDPEIIIGIYTSSPYLAKDARATLKTNGSKTRISLSGFDIERDYLSDLLGDERGVGGGFQASRDLASNLSIDFNASYSDIERGQSLVGPVGLNTTHDYDTEIVIRGNRDIGSRVTASLEAGFLSRSGDHNYDGWWVGLRGLWTPSGRGSAAGSPKK